MATDRRGIIRFTIENMIRQCGFKIRTGKKESAEQFKKLLYMLQRQSIIEILLEDKDNVSPLIECYRLKDLIMCSLCIDMSNYYTELVDSEKDKIITQTIEVVDNFKLLLYYCYLKCRIYKRSNDDSIEVNGGRAEVGFPSFKTINEDLHITDDTITKYNKILEDLDLIRISSAGNWYYKDDSNKLLKDSCNIYTLFTDEETVQHNLKEGVKYYKALDINKNKIFTNSKEYKNNNKKLNGELGSIIKKELHGTVTEKDIARKNEIINSISANDDKQFNIKALLEANPDMILSDIYYGFNSDKKAEKYYNLEILLGLINSKGKLLVDHDYYKWAMMNQDKLEHDYLVNCISKHKREALDFRPVKVRHLGRDKLKPYIEKNWEQECNDFDQELDLECRRLNDEQIPDDAWDAYYKELDSREE